MNKAQALALLEATLKASLEVSLLVAQMEREGRDVLTDAERARLRAATEAAAHRAHDSAARL